jgi:hypothetical protein
MERLTLDEIEKAFPDFKDFIEEATNQGYTSEEIIKYI